MLIHVDPYKSWDIQWSAPAKMRLESLLTADSSPSVSVAGGRTSLRWISGRSSWSMRRFEDFLLIEKTEFGAFRFDMSHMRFQPLMAVEICRVFVSCVRLERIGIIALYGLEKSASGASKVWRKAPYSARAGSRCGYNIRTKYEFEASIIVCTEFLNCILTGNVPQTSLISSGLNFAI